MWDPTAVKAQLRLTSQRLGQLQEKKDSQGTITRKDIATLLQQNQVGLARAKAQNLIQEDVMGDLLEVLEMHVGLILEHFTDVDQNTAPSPILVEAASSIIFAAPYTESKDLNIVRDLLIERLGPDFARAAIANRDNYVSQRVSRALAAPPPSAGRLDAYLKDIATKHGVVWSPGPQRQDVLDPLSEILGPETSPIVDLAQLRKLCSQGIPDEPSWLRPRIWKLFFGVLPVMKALWKIEMQKQRDSYYDLIRRLLPPFSHLPLPSTPLASLDASLINVSTRLSRVPQSLFYGLEDELDLATFGPLHPNAPEDARISCAFNLDDRLKLLQADNGPHTNRSMTPEIRLDEPDILVPEISVSSPQSGPSDTHTKTLFASQPQHLGTTHAMHCSALLRLLFLHSSINPGNLSPHVSTLLVPLYGILINEVEPDDLAHVEADTFWLFEAVIGEFSELEDEEGGSIWMRRLSERLKWADNELWENLNSKGLDPALPHYSYRWLAPLLTQTIPLSSAILIWDVLFSCDSRERDVNPKLERLIDVCTAMLLRAKVPLAHLGKATHKAYGLWTDEDEQLPPPSPLRSWELGDAFLAGMSLLQLYPLEAAGGIERILQTTDDLAQRRIEEAKQGQPNKLSLGARLKVTMWKGFTNQISSPDGSPDDSPNSDDNESDIIEDDGNETETPPAPEAPGLTSRLAATVWRGITNQSSMETPPSPFEPSSPYTSQPTSPSLSPSPSPSPSSRSYDEVIDLQSDNSPTQGSSPGTSGIWSYAEKLKDSDAAAALAKVSTNWRAKALLNSWGNRAQNTPPATPPMSPVYKGSRGGSVSESDIPKLSEERRISLPVQDRSNIYSPPPRPAFFRSPRDSWVPGEAQGLPSLTEVQGVASTVANKAMALRTSLTSAQPSQASPKAGPRPLLLGSSSVITGQSIRPISRSANNTPAPDGGQWADVMRAKTKAVHRESQSSISSLSPSDALGRPRLSGSRSDWESDAGSSRVVPLNRRSVSPMAPRLFKPHARGFSGSSSAASSDRGTLSPSGASPQQLFRSPADVTVGHVGWGQLKSPDSPPAPSPPKTPHGLLENDRGVRVTESEHQRGSVVLTSLEALPLEPPTPARKLTRKKTPPPSHYREDDTSDSSATGVPPRTPRSRSKKYPRLTNLHIQEMPRSKVIAEQKASPGSLAVEWPHEDQDVALTPRASDFDADTVAPSPRSPRPSRKISGDAQERQRKPSGDDSRTRKNSADQRTRKVSGTKEAIRRVRDSSADEGDDEGYDDLLSAYESEEGSKSFLP